MNKTFVKILGWYGVLAILLGFFLASFGMILPREEFYLFLNLTGAAAMAIECYSKKDFPPMTLNAVWFLIALMALARGFFLHR